MAKKKAGYVEPADYLPADVRKKLEADVAAKRARNSTSSKPKKTAKK